MTPRSHRVIIRIEAEVDITDAAIWYHSSDPASATTSSPKSNPPSPAPS